MPADGNISSPIFLSANIILVVGWNLTFPGLSLFMSSQRVSYGLTFVKLHSLLEKGVENMEDSASLPTDVVRSVLHHYLLVIGLSVVMGGCMLHKKRPRLS